MALNPPVLHDHLPAPVNGEYMVIMRKNIEAEIVLETNIKYKGKGRLYLTTVRMVFVNEKSDIMTSFDIPIDLMSGEKFNQPIFGANYISGKVLPLYNLIPCPATFKFWFNSGGVGTFLPLFYNIIGQIRKRRGSGNQGPDPRFVECVANGNLRNVAYIDPNDPSVIFIQQPQAPNPPQNNVNYYFPQPGAVQPPPPVYVQPIYSQPPAPSYPQQAVPSYPPERGNHPQPSSYPPQPNYSVPPNNPAQPNYISNPPQSYPPLNYPPQSYPPQNYPPQNYPPSSINFSQPNPPQAYPPQGFPPASNNPPQAYRPQGFPPVSNNPPQAGNFNFEYHPPPADREESLNDYSRPNPYIEPRNK